MGEWLPEGKTAAVCLSVDDVHPATSAGSVTRGDLAVAALAHLRALQEKHASLRVTLFTTPDWRSSSPVPGTHWSSRTPLLRHVIFHARPLQRGLNRIERDSGFASLLRSWPRSEVGLHGLNHVRRGVRPVVEFHRRTRRACERILRRSAAMFADARIPIVSGVCPPGWEAPPGLLQAMGDLGMLFVSSARDLDTPISRYALTNGSGLRGVALIEPQWIQDRRLVHVPVNFQATSSFERAHSIVENGGVL